ncbi:MAG TPA: hypothetical protein VM052_00015 [Candidatus Limnocylindrales bacterium]|nr:hypothetical protein [Candidatus Limnocylindrales bacterium]
MRFFRSEDHARRAQQSAPSDTLTLEQAAKLARSWYAKKLTPGWRRHTPLEAAALFSELGLDPEFWRLE